MCQSRRKGKLLVSDFKSVEATELLLLFILFRTIMMILGENDRLVRKTKYIFIALLTFTLSEDAAVQI